jgi:superfamily I DNA/RNA helicase
MNISVACRCAASRIWINCRGRCYARINTASEALIDVLYETALVASMGKTDATLFREYRVALTNWVSACADQCAHAGEDNAGELNASLLALLRLLSAQVRNDSHKQDLMTLTRLLTRRLGEPLQARLRAIDQWAKHAPHESGEDRAQLTLMTIHAAKGMEFGAVWLAGAHENLLPHEGCEIEEERRLFYVAVTRARQRLTVSYARDQLREPSRFLSESGFRHTAWACER